MDSGLVILRVLYRSDGRSNPGTKARAREVADLARSGLRQALASFESGDVAMCGTSGFSQREDILSVGSPAKAKLVGCRNSQHVRGPHHRGL